MAPVIILKQFSKLRILSSQQNMFSANARDIPGDAAIAFAIVSAKDGSNNSSMPN
jgi:hypothetical protein